MSVKKLLILTAVGVASVGTTAAMAGGPDMMAAPAPVESYFYVEGNIGYAFQDFAFEASNAFNNTGNAFLVSFPTSGPQSTGASGGLVYGGDFGYMFNQYIGLELGWTYLPRFVNTYPQNSFLQAFPTGLSFRNSGAAWGVIKLVAPFTECFNAFVKAGIAYRYGSLIFAGLGVVHMEEWRPTFGAGLSYNIGENWMTSLSWMHFMGGTSYSPNSATSYVSTVVPSSDVIMFSLGYKFTV